MADHIVNGYAYPSISEETLDWWLPRLSWASAFSYGFTESGELVNLKDEELIQAANAAGVRPMMVLTPLDEAGNFNDNIAIKVFENPQAKENLISNIEANIIRKNMGGVDFDFEYLSADYADDYVRLIADYCLLMTYEWGYTYGPPMPVSPINNVRRVLEFGVSQIPSEKILMGMSNYGYDWRLPFVRGESKAEKLTNYQAEARAAYYGFPIEYDEEAQAPFFTYTAADGSEHIVWFENEKSWQARLDLVEEYGLAGVSIWNIMHIFYGGI